MCIASLARKIATYLTMASTALALLSVAQAAGTDSPKHVLVLYSHSRLVPSNVLIDQSLSAALLDDSEQPLRMHSEFLDEPEFGGEAYESTMVAYLHEKYKSAPPAVIIAVADSALSFVLHHRAELFPSAPVVHVSVFSKTLQALQPMRADIVGVSNNYDYSGTIVQALHWHPNARRLILVLGASAYDHEDEARLRKEVPAIAGSATPEYWSGLPRAVLEKKLRSLGSDAVVFTPGFYQDGGGDQYTPRDVAAFVAGASAAPVYGPWLPFIGTGIVGGRMPSPEKMGGQAAQTVKALLAGTAPAALRLAHDTPTTLHVDWRQVQRWGIDTKLIPADAVVHFRDPTLWEAHRTAVMIVISVFLIQTALIASLYVERRRRSVAESTTQMLNTQLAHASRLAVAGELTASIAHEINQPLGSMQTSADTADLILQARPERDEALIRIVTRIRSDNMRASQVIRRLRTLLARQVPERRPFDTRVAITDVAMILRPEAERRKVAFNVQLLSSPAIIEGDQTQIQQVLINLALNAMDAAAGLADNRRLVEVSMRQAPSTIVITVRDQGPGVPVENLPKVFDSFFSTKQSGMGLGLSIARSIVESHGGRIWVENGEPHGAAFHIELHASKLDSGTLQGAG
jgi:signal transduction histidine kinase